MLLRVRQHFLCVLEWSCYLQIILEALQKIFSYHTEEFAGVCILFFSQCLGDLGMRFLVIVKKTVSNNFLAVIGDKCMTFLSH